MSRENNLKFEKFAWRLSQFITQVRLVREQSRPTRPKSNPLVKSLDAWMATWVMYAASSCVDSLVQRSALEFYNFSPMDYEVRWMAAWLPMDELRAV